MLKTTKFHGIATIPSTRNRDWIGMVAKTIIILQGVAWIGSISFDYLATSSRSAARLDYKWTDTINIQKCRPPLPQLPVDAISPTDLIFHRPSKSLDHFLKARISRPDIDSLAIAVVTPSGAVFQKGYGVLKANETDSNKGGPVDENSIYRIASMTKMFNVLETLILRDRGVLNWDDPVTKFFPHFTYNPSSWPEYLNRQNHSFPERPREPITVRQLASHMSGIGRDYPMLMDGNFTLPTRHDVLKYLKDHPLILPPYSYPVYSNTGFSLLGWINVEANAVSGNRSQEPFTYSDLLRRDVFQRVGMNSSSFTVFPEMVKRVAVAAQDNWDTYLDFTDVFNPTGGQYSSLLDLTVFMETLLNPNKGNSVLSSHTVREWLRPLHGWSDEFNEAGAPWEITKHRDSFGAKQRFYQKGGNLPSHHSHFGINPTSSYGVIVLVAGQYATSVRLAYEAIKRFQPVFDELRLLHSRNTYAGRWASKNGIHNQATISARSGSLWIDRLIVNGVDTLALLQGREPGKSIPLTLWNTGPERPEEFRIAVGRAEWNDDPLAGCEPYWVSIDSTNFNGIPIDLLYFEKKGGEGERTLKIPSAGVTMTRVPDGV